jgi:DNA-binding NarL/FixJ family response regulator
MTIRVLIVDDQSLVREGVGKAENGREGVDLALKLRPDVVLMDVRMPEMDGIEATTRLLRHGAEQSELRVLALTTYDSEDFAVRMLAAGASGFLLKDAPGEDLIRAIRTVYEGNAIIDPSMTRTLLHRFTSPGRVASEPVDRDTLVANLTEREREVLAQLVRGVSNAQIARELFLAEVTVKTHVGRILDKLDLPDRVHVVIWAYESGYIDREL